MTQEPTESVTDLVINERETDEGTLVSVCDAELIGETFEEGEISLTVSEEFYGGADAEAERVVRSLANCSVANLVGARCVGLAIEHGFVDEENVLDVDGTRHAQLLWM